MKTSTKKARAAFCHEHGCLCFACGGAGGQDVHEILRGNACRHNSVVVRSCWLLLCRPCHELMDDYSIWSVEKQLCLKLLVDREFFDLDEVNSISVKKRDMDEILGYMREVKYECGL